MAHADSLCLEDPPLGSGRGVRPHSTFKGVSEGHVPGAQTHPLHFAVRTPGVQASSRSRC